MIAQNKKDVIYITNKFLMGTYLYSYLIRGMIYSLFVAFIYFSFLDFMTPYNGQLIDNDYYHNVFNIYSFKSIVGSYFVFIFLIEGLVVLFDSINYKKQHLIYRVGRTNDYFKSYFKTFILRLFKSSLTVFLSFFAVCIIFILADYIMTKEISFTNVEYYLHFLNFDKLDAFITINIAPFFYLIVVWIPAILEFIISFTFVMLVMERVKNIIIIVILSVFIYIVLTILLIGYSRDLIYFIPIFPIMNIQSISSHLFSITSIIVQIGIVLLIIKIRKWRKWDEI